MTSSWGGTLHPPKSWDDIMHGGSSMPATIMCQNQTSRVLSSLNSHAIAGQGAVPTILEVFLRRILTNATYPRIAILHMPASILIIATNWTCIGPFLSCGSITKSAASISMHDAYMSIPAEMADIMPWTTMMEPKKYRRKIVSHISCSHTDREEIGIRDECRTPDFSKG